MYNILFTILVGSFFSSDPGKDHAIYLSVAEVVHEKSMDNASVKIKVFTNDIEDAIMNELNKRLQLSDTSAFDTQKQSIENYFSNHFLISINKRNMKITMVKSELVGDAIWFYFKMNCQSNWDVVSVKADYLMELFPTQSNVISIEHNSKKKFVRLTKSKKSETIKF